jgi:molybdopterin-guanine dinucleotide biosynthesis protein A
VTGAIVAGGANERFGREPKGLRRVGGIRIIDRVATAIRAVTPEIILVANAPDAERWLAGTPVRRDVRSERGSVVGLHTAIASIPADDIALVVAWDMPFVSAGLLSLLTHRVREGAAAAIPESPSGPEPFCAAYTTACLADIERAVVRGDFRMSSIVETLPDVSRVADSEVRSFGDPARLFFNVNTRADLETAERIAADG